MNYGNNGRLIEDFWDAEWETVAGDFREMKALGYNVVRVHLQLGKFMTAPDRMNRRSLDQLGRLLKLAEETGLYLDLTGLACYRKSDTPSWYDPLTEEERRAVQARFWRGIADRCAGHPAVFCYDLINEPLSPSGARKLGEWYSGSLLGGLDFLQYIALDQRGRERPEIARQWIRRMREAIRKEDRNTLITVGLLPSTKKWGHFSGFTPEKVAPELDFVSVHIYPETGKVDEALDTLKGFAVGKPVVIEETFPLSCPPADLEQFLLRSRAHAVGWLGHYDGRTLAEYDERRKAKTLTIPEAVWLSWLELSRKLKPLMVGDGV
ncbi:MAG: cellulase family glycosylhydrolase [Actinomycetota bacterium]